MDDRESEEAEVLEDDEFGPLEVFTESVTVSVNAGGWHWLGTSPDRSTAIRRLKDRLRSRNPFDGADTGWGDPGHQVNELHPSIKETVEAYEEG